MFTSRIICASLDLLHTSSCASISRSSCDPTSEQQGPHLSGSPPPQHQHRAESFSILAQSCVPGSESQPTVHALILQQSWQDISFEAIFCSSSAPSLAISAATQSQQASATQLSPISDSWDPPQHLSRPPHHTQQKDAYSSIKLSHRQHRRTQSRSTQHRS